MQLPSRSCTSLLLLTVLLFGLVASAAAFRPDRPPRSLSEAADYHRAATATAHTTMRANGHLPPPMPAVLANRVQRTKSPSLYAASLNTASLASLPAPALTAMAVSNSSGASPVFYPRLFGADPSGFSDSTVALQKAMAALLASNTTRATSVMASGIRDLGGATLDLEGGLYNISAPLIVPPFYGNLHIVRGTLRASPQFPANESLIRIGDPGCNPDQQGSCNEFVEVSQTMLDCAHVASGGITVSNVMGTTLGPALFVHGFTNIGIHLVAGHEVMISEAWLCEYFWSDSHQPTNSVGIQLDGNDHYLSNVIIFSYTNTGVVNNHAANLFYGVHTWNNARGIGIDNNTPQARFIGVYLDYSYLRLIDPIQVIVESSFFLHTNAVLQAGPQAKIDGLVMQFNSWSSGFAPTVNGTFASCKSFTLDGGFNNPVRTIARLAVAVNNTTSVTVDFQSSLILPQIDFVEYSVMLETGSAPVPHALGPISGTSVTVNFARVVNGTVFVTARQCL